MYGLSRIPQSAQRTPHRLLPQIVLRHLQKPFRKPIAPYNAAAFEQFYARWDQAGRLPLVLDAGCGTGYAALVLAQRHPDCFILGVDQSAVRLSKRKPFPEALWPERLMLIRADLIDFWRLLLAANLRLRAHYWFYPNPWPKIGHLQRRWYAHPIWPTILALGGALECRTNWAIYAKELAITLFLSGIEAELQSFYPDQPISLFERKYRDSGHILYRVRAELSIPSG